MNLWCHDIKTNEKRAKVEITLGKNLIFEAAEAVSMNGISGGRIYGIKSRKLDTKPLAFSVFRGQEEQCPAANPGKLPEK